MVGADGKVAQVSAASILAKVSRDALMRAWGSVYGGYGFAAHKGYATKAHLGAIAARGYCEIHRKSFVLKARQNSLFD